ncbi:hypothetical protein ACYULU_04855 [Breznakiellaceae bacterium SP9]
MEYLDVLYKHLTAIVSFVFTTRGLVAMGILLVLLPTAMFLFQSVYKTRILLAGANDGETRLDLTAKLSCLCEFLGKIVHNIGVLLPLLAGTFVLLLAVTLVVKIAVEIQAFIGREQHIKELSIAIKYLEQREKVLDLRVLSVTDGITTLQLRYDAAGDPDGGIPSTQWRKDITIAGTDIHVDCLVLNFTYSEVSSGRQRNIAIPYRVYSNVVPAVEAQLLHLVSGDIPNEDDFGFIPAVYKERLTQLLTDPDFAHAMGVRSVNGNAVHRFVSSGDRYKIIISNTGGIHLE